MRTILLALEDRLLITDDVRRDEPTVALAGRAPRALTAVNGLLVCGTDGHGVWRSADGGRGWQPVQHAPARVTALAAHGATLLCGTEPSAVWRSDDAGATWRALPPLTTLASSPSWSYPPRPDTHHVRALLIDPAQPDRWYVAIEAGALVRTPDGGASWIDRTPDAPRDTHTLRVHPRDSGRLYAAAGDGWFESRDAGANWERPRDGLGHHYMWSLVAHPAEPELRVVSAAAGARQAHDARTAEAFLYRRTRMSEWELCAQGLPPARGTTIPLLVNDPVDADTFWLASNHGVFRSRDAGLTWRPLPSPWPPDLRDQRVRDLLVIGAATAPPPATG